MDTQHQRYLSYLLRLWISDSEGAPVWRASLENPHTGERLIFTTLSRLFAFLEDQCGQEDTGNPAAEENHA